MKPDNRHFEREEKSYIVNIKPSGLTGSYYMGLTKNVSMDGFSFESQNYNLIPGDCIEFELKDPQGGLNVSAAGRVVWKRETDFECLAAVKFLGLDDNSRKSIMENVPETQQGNDAPPVHEELPSDAESKRKGPDVGEEEGVISQVISRVTDRMALDDAVRDISSVWVSPLSGDQGIHGKSSVNVENEAAELQNDIFGHEAYQGDNASIYKSRHDIAWDISEEEKVLLQGIESDKARNTHWYIAAVAIMLLIAFAVLMRSDLITNVEAPLPEAVQGQTAVTGSIDVNNKILSEREEDDTLPPANTLIPLTAPEKSFPVIDASQKQPIEVDDEAAKPLTAEKTEIKTVLKTVHKNMQAPSVSANEVPAPSEEIVVEPEKLRSDTAGESKKQAATTLSPSEKPVSDRNINKSADVQDSEKAVITDKVQTIETSTPDKTKELPTENLTGPDDLNESDAAAGSSRNENITYQELFENNTNNWKQFDTYAASAQIKEGEYYLENKRGSGPHLVFHDRDFQFGPDFMIEISIRTVKTFGSFAYGLVFSAKDALDNYAFQIVNNEGYSIRKYEKGVLKELASGTLTNIYSNLHNTLRVSRQGKIMSFFINGEYLTEIPDLPYIGRRMGFIIEGQSEVAIDRTYFRLKKE